MIITILNIMYKVVILSQLQAFSGDSVTVVDMAVPIVSALAFLIGGGYLAVFVIPEILNSVFLDRQGPESPSPAARRL